VKKISIFLIAALLSACAIKQTREVSLYELKFSGDLGNCGMKGAEIYLHSVYGVGASDNKEIVVFDENNRQIDIGEAKFISRPSEMIYKMAIDALNSSCKFAPIFSRNSNTELRLKLLNFSIENKFALTQIGYELTKNQKMVKNGIISEKIPLLNLTPQDAYNALNLGANNAINKIIKELK